jgi:hypothetical protein
MARKNGNGNGGNGNGGGREGEQPLIARGRRITADDLTRAASAAREAAAAASQAAEAVVVALESGDIDESLVGMESEREGAASGQVQGGGEEREGRVAFEEFMAQLSGILRKAGDAVDVTEHSRWVKIESRKNGHKVYVAKGKNQVNRIESTLPPELIPGATEPDRKNGRIASYIPAEPKAVTTAIRALVQLDEKLRPPQRGGGQEGGGGGPGGGGRRSQKESN